MLCMYFVYVCRYIYIYIYIYMYDQPVLLRGPQSARAHRQAASPAPVVGLRLVGAQQLRVGLPEAPEGDVVVDLRREGQVHHGVGRALLPVAPVVPAEHRGAPQARGEPLRLPRPHEAQAHAYLGAKDCTPEINTSEIVNFQEHFPGFSLL